MSSVHHVVAFDHLFIGKAGTVVTDSTSLDGHEEWLSIFVFLFDKLGIVIEFIKRC